MTDRRGEYPEANERRDERDDLVDSLVRGGYVETEGVESAMRAVPRERFLPPEAREDAYADRPLPIGDDQTVSAPHMVAMMTEALDLSPGDRVLEVGTGRGYHAAVVAEVVSPGNVYTVEYHRELAEAARDNLPDGVTVVHGDGSTGYDGGAPYDRVYLTCAAPDVPGFVDDQLRNGGRAVLPVARGRAQRLVTVDKEDDGMTMVTDGDAVRFVRLVGDEGY